MGEELGMGAHGLEIWSCNVIEWSMSLYPTYLFLISCTFLNAIGKFHMRRSTMPPLLSE